MINDKINKEINQKSNDKESLFDIENYNAYVQLNNKNMISQRIKSSKKLFKCTYPGCLKMYSAPYNLKVNSLIKIRFITDRILERDPLNALS